MKKLFTMTFVLTLCALLISPIYTTQADYFKTEYTQQEIKELITYKAKVYGVSEKTMNHIVNGESSYRQRAIKKNDGKIGCTARGTIQLNDCYMGKGIPDKLAFHPPYAIDKLALELKRGQCGQWSTCPQ
jgi:hypothetical protein